MRTRLFLYGTLRDPALYEIVAGRPLDGAVAARLEGHAVRSVEDGRYPDIHVDPDACAEGLLVEVDDAGLERFDFYETGFGYARRAVEIEAHGAGQTAEAWFPDDAGQGEGRWSLEAWQARHAALAREAAVEFMSLMGQKLPEEAAAIHGAIMARAAARLRARAGPSPEGPGRPMPASDVEKIDISRPFAGFFALREDRLRFPTFEDGMSAEVTRLSLEAADAVTVLPYDRNRDRVLVLRQFRHGPFVRDDPNPWTFEPVAGRIDPGETAEATALRELHEEAGIDGADLLRMAGYYPSPGPLSEHVTSFLGLVDLPEDLDGRIRGLEDEAEDIMLHLVSFDELMSMISSGAANTGTLVLSALWLARERDRLPKRGFS